MKGKVFKIQDQLVNNCITQTQPYLRIKVCEQSIAIKKLGERPHGPHEYENLDKMEAKLAKLKTELKVAELNQQLKSYLERDMFIDGDRRAKEYEKKYTEQHKRRYELEETLITKDNKLKELESEVEHLKAKLPVEPVGKIDLD